MTPISLTDSDTLQHEGSQQLSNDDRSLAHRSMKVLSVKPACHHVITNGSCTLLRYGSGAGSESGIPFGNLHTCWAIQRTLEHECSWREEWDAVGRPGGRSSKPTQGAGEVRSRAGQEVGARWPASELAHEQLASRRTSERVLLGSAAALCEGSLCLSVCLPGAQSSLRTSLPCPFGNHAPPCPVLGSAVSVVLPSSFKASCCLASSLLQSSGTG